MTENKEARLATRRERDGEMSDFIAIAQKEVERRTRPSGFTGQMSLSNEQRAARTGYRLGFIDAAEWARETIWGEAIQEARKEAWEEGYEAAEINEHEHRPGRKLTNPYTAQRNQTSKEAE